MLIERGAAGKVAGFGPAPRHELRRTRLELSQHARSLSDAAATSLRPRTNP